MYAATTHPADELPRAFVVGCQKSGTTWLQRLLEEHPEVCSHGEACFAHALTVPMLQALDGYNTRQRVGEMNTFSDPDAAAVVRHAACVLQRKWYDASAQRDALRIIAEKTPEHAVTLGVLDAVFPGMRVIHIIRDGRDGVVSGWHHNLRESGDAFRERFSEMHIYARYFVEHHWIPYITRARAWGAANPSRYHELRYESLLEHPSTHAREIFEFLGVDARDEAVERATDSASFHSLSGGRERGETDNGSHFRKGVAGGWRSDLDEQSVRAFEELGAPMLNALGYPLAGAVAAE